MKVASIVEGEGDVAALPVLLRRLAFEAGAYDLELLHPLRLARGKMVKPAELRRHVELAARRTDRDDAILVVLDADDDCPADLGPRLLAHALEQRNDRRISVIVIPREFEAWFLAGAAGLAGKRGLPQDLQPPPRPEAFRDAKGWLARHMERGYHATRDQEPFAAIVDLEAARQCDSFARLARIVKAICSPPEQP